MKFLIATIPGTLVNGIQQRHAWFSRKHLTLINERFTEMLSSVMTIKDAVVNPWATKLAGQPIFGVALLFHVDELSEKDLLPLMDNTVYVEERAYVVSQKLAPPAVRVVSVRVA